MNISLFYDNLGECKSQLLALSIHGPYHITLHLLSQESKDTCVYYQSRPLTTDEMEEMMEKITVACHEQNVPDHFIELFQRYCYTE